MSTRVPSGKSKAATKTGAKSKTRTATPGRSRLTGPKPPKARPAGGTVSNQVTTAAKATKQGTSKIPAPGTPAPVSRETPAELKKRELIELVVAKSDIKKKYAKPVIEAMLDVLGDTLAKGREMNLQPFGKVKLNRSKETQSARITVAKIRQNKAAKPAASPSRPAGKLADSSD